MQASATLQLVPLPSLDYLNSLLAPAQVSVSHCLHCGCRGSMNGLHKRYADLTPTKQFQYLLWDLT